MSIESKLKQMINRPFTATDKENLDKHINAIIRKLSIPQPDGKPRAITIQSMVILRSVLEEQLLLFSDCCRVVPVVIFDAKPDEDEYV